MINIRIALTSAMIAALAIGSAAPAFADNYWQRTHPRREQVNNRVFHQERQIREEVREGQLSRGQGRALMQQEHGVLAEERADARLDGSHITRSEQRQLNGDLNAIHNEIPR
jgi:hypothetical protein